MQIDIKLREVGSSFGIILSKTLTKLLDITAGDYVPVKFGRDGDFVNRKVIKIGSSQGIIITRGEALALGVRDGHMLKITLDNKKLVITNKVDE